MALVSRVKMTINGNVRDDIQSFSDDDREIRQTVRLMDRFEFLETTYPNTFKFSAVVIKGQKETDWKNELTGTETVSVAKEGGGHYVFLRCSVLMIGGVTATGEGEMVREITCFAQDRSDN